MNPGTFDRITRLLGRGMSRRKGLIGLTGVAATLALGADGAEAGCKKVGKKCKKNRDCCSGAKCTGNKRRKRCACKPGRQDCDGDGRCENLNTDRNNCGQCSVGCVSPDACCDGACNTTCVL